MADDLDPDPVAMVREHYRVECALDDPKTRLYRGHVGILLAALAAARDGAWATDTDGGGSLCSSCGIGHDRGECTPAAPRHFAPYGLTSATCGETVPRRVSWDAPAGECADARFTVRRVRVTCPECRWRLGLGPARDGEAVDPREVAHIECDCSPSLGPSHCHLCGVRAGREVAWSEAHPAPTVTAEQRAAVRAAIVDTIRDGVAWDGDAMADAALAALGIEVREP